MGRGSGDEILSVGLPISETPIEGLKDVSPEDGMDAFDGAQSLKASSSWLNIIKSSPRLTQFNVLPQSEQEARARALMAMLAELKIQGQVNREVFADPSLEYRRHDLLKKHDKIPFSIYPFPVTVEETGDVLDPDGNVIDHLSTKDTPNLLLALSAEQGASWRLGSMLLSDEGQRNEILDAAYRESSFYNRIFDDQGNEKGTGDIFTRGDGTYGYKTLKDADGNIIFARLTSHDGEEAGTVEKSEFFEDVEKQLGRNTQGADLTGWRLNGSDFRGRDLTGITLGDYSDLEGSKFNNANLNRVKADGSSLEGGSFVGAEFNDCDIKNTSFHKSSFGDSYSEGVTVTNSKIRNSYFNDSEMSALRVSGSDFDQSSFRDVDFNHGAVIENSSVKGVSFDGAKGDSITFRNVDARGISANGLRIEHYSEIVNSDFSNSNMPGIQFSGGSNYHSGYAGAALRDSSFENCIMPGCYIGGVREAEFVESHSKIDGATVTTTHEGTGAYDNIGRRLNFRGAQMQNSRIEGSEIRDSSFEGANLVGTTIVDCDMENTSFVGADVAGVRFQGVRNLNLEGALNADQAIIEPLNEQNCLKGGKGRGEVISVLDDKTHLIKSIKNSNPEYQGFVEERSIKEYEAILEESSKKRASKEERSEAASKLSSMHGSALKKTAKKRASKKDRLAALRAIHQRNPDASNAEIAEEMGVSSARVSQLRKEAGIPGKRGRPKKS